MDTSLKHKLAVVTGATSGVGRAVALALAQAGANLLLIGRRMTRLRKVASVCGEQGAVVSCYEVDLLSPGQIMWFGRQVKRDWGDIDLLIHSAGILRPNGIAKARLQDFDLQYQCNVRAPFALTRALLSGLIAKKGQIVFINSTSGLYASCGLSQYSATKHALKALADSFREELNPLGIRIVSFYLGRTATPMQVQMHRAEQKRYRPEHLIQPEQVSDVVIQTLSMSREAEIMDVRIRPAMRPKEIGNVHVFRSAK